MEIRIRTEGPKVLVNFDDRVFLEMGHEQVAELTTQLRRAGLLAQEYAEAERLIFEGAMCARAGLPLTLSNHPKILDRVRIEAAANRDLRRYMPGEVKARELVGTPTVVQEQSK